MSSLTIRIVATRGRVVLFTPVDVIKGTACFISIQIPGDRRSRTFSRCHTTNAGSEAAVREETQSRALYRGHPAASGMISLSFFLSFFGGGNSRLFVSFSPVSRHHKNREVPETPSRTSFWATLVPQHGLLATGALLFVWKCRVFFFFYSS